MTEYEGEFYLYHFVQGVEFDAEQLRVGQVLSLDNVAKDLKSNLWSRKRFMFEKKIVLK